MIPRVAPVSLVSTFRARLKSDDQFPFDFRHAIGVAITLHIVLTTLYLIWHKPEVVEVPFTEIHVKLGDMKFDSIAEPAEVPSVPVKMAPQAPVQPPLPQAPQQQQSAQPPTPRPETKPDTPRKSMEEMFADALASIPLMEPDDPSTAPPTEPQQQPHTQQQPTEASPNYERRPPVEQQQLIDQQQNEQWRDPSIDAKAGHEQGNRKYMGEMNPTLTYPQLLSLWMEKHKTYPQAAVDNKMTGEAIIRIDVEKSGYITRYILEKKTGHPLLDDAIIQMVERANPVPPIPDNETARAFRIPVRFFFD